MAGWFKPRSLPLVIVALAALLLAALVGFAPSRRILTGLLSSLRMQKVQAVNVDLSGFVGPNANPTLQQMVQQMISDKVDVTANEPDQRAGDRARASELAGFPVRLLAERPDPPALTVSGRHAFNLAVDRARLQAILMEAGRSDLVLPASIDGAAVSVSLPPSVHAQYGTCPGPASAAANVVTPPPASTQYDDCLVVTEGLSPSVSVPAELDVQALVQIGLELAGMNADQAREFLKTVNWQSTLGVSVPRSMRSYQGVTVDGVLGTLLNTAGRRGPTYALIWAKNGMVYSVTGFGNSANAVALADSLK